MKRSTVLAAFLSLCVFSFAQDKKNDGAPPAAEVVDAKVPFFGNETCSYMTEKRTKQGLYAETTQGRVYVCCKDCLDDARKDGEKAAAKAYPKTNTLENATCPVTGAAIGPKAQTLKWQGYEFKLATKEAVESFKKNPDLYLALLTTPGLKDVGNTSCPVTDKEADGGCVIVGDEIVRVRSRKDADEFKKDAAKYLAKAKASVKKPAGGGKAPEKPKKG
jgi:hypothetical protein